MKAIKITEAQAVIIPVSPEIRERLKTLKRGGESYTKVLERLLSTSKAYVSLISQGSSLNIGISRVITLSLSESEAQGLREILAFNGDIGGSVRFKTVHEPLAKALHDKLLSVLEAA